MRLILRLSFWLLLALMVIPVGGDDHVARVEPTGPIQAVDAARQALDDIAGICERRPEVCATGRQVLQSLGEKAREGARLAYETLDRKYGDADISTGSVPAAK